MSFIHWLVSLGESFTRSHRAANHINETLEEIDAKLRERSGLAPRGPDGKPIEIIDNEPKRLNGRSRVAR